jgi:hypothetical protein
MHETIISREALYVIAEGDVRRAYECVKVCAEFNLKHGVTHFEV